LALVRAHAARAANLAFACALTLTLCCGVAAADGGTLRAFLLAGSPDSVADLESHANAVGVLYPTYFYCRVPGGQIAGAAEASVDEYAAAQRIAVMPRFSCQQKMAVHRILTDPAVRRDTLADLAALASNSLYEGLCLDLENDGASDRDALDSFVAALARRLHAIGRKLSVVVDGVTHEDAQASTGFYDDSRLAELADEVFVLAWGVHWEHSAPGPIAPLSWVRKVAAYVASLPDARRFVLGAPMYGLDWEGSVRATAYQYSDITALAGSVGATPVRDPGSGEMTFSYLHAGVRHTVFYLDAHAVAARLQAGRDAGLEVGVWRLGGEDQALWSSPVTTDGS
jgi:spore germination protein YaaH